MNEILNLGKTARQ